MGAVFNLHRARMEGVFLRLFPFYNETVCVEWGERFSDMERE